MCLRIAKPAIIQATLSRTDFPPNYGLDQKEKEDILKLTRLGDGVI